MKKVYILSFFLVVAGLSCYAQVDRPATKQERIDAAKKFVQYNSGVNRFNVLDFIKATGLICTPESYSKNLKKRADNGDAQAMRDVVHDISITCNLSKEKELHKAQELFADYEHQAWITYEVESTYGNQRALMSLAFISNIFRENYLSWSFLVNLWETPQWHESNEDILESTTWSCGYARALILADIEDGSGDVDEGMDILERNVMEDEDIISAIMLIKTLKYLTNDYDIDYSEKINLLTTMLSIISDGQITDIPVMGEFKL